MKGCIIMGIMKNIFQNTRKPEGLLGKMMIKSMNKGHSRVSDWGIEKIPEGDYRKIAELGCGGGKTAEKLLKKYPEAHLTGVDYSDVSVKMATDLNAGEIKNGRCTILQGDVSALPFEDESFDLATAFETVYFWPGPSESFKEVLRILKPGGYFLIVNESDGYGKSDRKWESMIDGLVIFNKEQIEDFLRDGGFNNIEIHHDDKTHQLCILAKKEI